MKTNGLFTKEPSRIYELDILCNGKELLVNLGGLEAKNLDTVLEDVQSCILLRYSALFGPHI